MSMISSSFGGNSKVGKSLLWDLEQRFIRANVEKIPIVIHSYHLTYMTMVWSLGVVLFSFFATINIQWLWGVSLCIFLQWLTDSFDGAVGRLRKEGLIKWGYYMDHFLDYIFLCSILIGYSLILPDNFKYLLFFILVIFGAFMVNSYLSFAATNEFRIAYFGVGPTEIRLLFIVINTLIILFGKTYLVWSLPYVLSLSIIGLGVVVVRTGKYLREIDMEEKKKREHKTQKLFHKTLNKSYRLDT